MFERTIDRIGTCFGLFMPACGVVLPALVALYWIHLTPADPLRDKPREGEIWVSAYLATWQHNAGTEYSNWGVYTVDQIDWGAFTHLIYFALGIGPDGRPGRSLDPRERNNLNLDRLHSIVPAAHRNGKKILLSVGGAGNYDGFSRAIRPENRDRFIGTLNQMITQFGFDGIDLDMEPILPDDFGYYRDFVISLHRHFSTLRTRSGETPLITIAALKGSRVLQLYAGIQEYVDQINLMTYDMAQSWSGWQAWHNSALYSSGVRFDRGGHEMTSVDHKVKDALAAGIHRYKIGIGIDFYGYIWHGVHRLGKWESWPQEDLSIMERPGGVPYSELRERFDLSRTNWDPIAETSYLETDRPKAFVSFDNERSVRRKVRYTAEEGLGGVILWELGGGFLPEEPSGRRDPLLRAVRDELQAIRSGSAGSP